MKSLKWATWHFSNSEMPLWCPWCLDGILSKSLINLSEFGGHLRAHSELIIIFHRFLSKIGFKTLEDATSESRLADPTEP